MTYEQAIAAQAGPIRHRFTVAEFLALDKAGMFDGVGRVELVEGDIYVMSPIHLTHGIAQARIIARLDRVLARRADLAVVGNVSAALDRHNLPEPDAAVLRLADERFATPSTTIIAIEIAVSSLSHDLGIKASTYARAGIPEYWVVDVNGRQIHRMSAPAGEAYAAMDLIPFGARLASATLPEIAIETAGLA